MSVKNPFLLPTLRSRFDTLPEDEKEVVAWIYDFARGDQAALLVGIMSGLALENPEATWLDIAKEVKVSLTK